MIDCYFCQLKQSKNSVIWEDDLLYAIFDNYPVSPGHALVIPQRHVVDFAELTLAEWRELNSTIPKTISVIENTDLTSLYQQFVVDHETDRSVWFCKKAGSKLSCV